ncbi:AfsR/SARP family transcriptional regulator [Nocardia sp. NRRL S-836]|uniref:AfsR/SARP family transcriptional regulator n=1 Tax=Nocardia sp. NRRL S-836 TaxID=1519492 RepID=UPI0006AF5266|nr:AfsR/SARP family transcriptional regulator [Nocardia sp. NRRL S-836]
MKAEYRVLGPLQVLLDGEPVTVPGGRCRVLLATLLLRANEVVSVGELVKRLWDGAPPAQERAHKTLQMVVNRLRQALGAAGCVTTHGGGYMAEIAPEQLDLTRFRALAEQGEPHAALALWRGPVLADVVSEPLHRDDVPALLEEHAAVLERRIDQDLTRDTAVLVPELRSLVQKHPLRETFWAQLVLALHRSDQQAEALAVYDEVRGLLARELGVEPGRRLREAHRQVLGGEVPPDVVPRQLPAGVRHFVGRERELARIGAAVEARRGEPVLISAINGIGGVGKTALAVRWAHQHADRFPDGQLHVNLRGFDVQAEPVDPVSVARDLLIALGTPPGAVPSSRDALLTAYRAALAPRRVLLVLDNARDAEQVRPLLPGGTAPLVLITSRNRLGELVTGQGAQLIDLDVLDAGQAVELLTGRIGTARVGAEPGAVRRLVKRCGGLPLALGIVAARAVWGDSLTTLADELDQERLGALDVDDDPATGVRGVFSWSLRSVSAVAARVFVLLGLHPGPEFTVDAVASLAAVRPAQARKAIDELVAGNLVETGENGRFSQHDLLRDYAAERAALLPEAERAAAVRRMFDHYLHTSMRAAAQVRSVAADPPVPPPVARAVVVPVAGLAAASEWFEAERATLLRVVTHAVGEKADDVAWALAFSMHLPVLRSGDLAAAKALNLQGLAAAERAGDRWGRARLHRACSGTCIAARELDQAERHLLAALALDEGDDAAEVTLSRGLGQVHVFQGRPDRAVAALLAVRDKAERVADEVERANYLATLGDYLGLAGDHDRALAVGEQARAVLRASDRAPGSVTCRNLESLAALHLRAGRHAEAVALYEESIGLLRSMRATYNLAHSLVLLGKVHQEMGDSEQCEAHLQEAEAIIGDRDDASSQDVRAELNAVRG